MIISKADILALHKKYARNDVVYTRFVDHCKIVAEISLWCAKNVDEDIDEELLEAAALLHDIGSYMLCNEEGSIDTQYYQLHGLFGASLLEAEGVDKRICDIVRSHQFSINTPKIIAFTEDHSPRTSKPVSVEAEIVQYADRFHSKQPIFNSDSFLMSFLEELPDRKKRYLDYKTKFGLPDLNPLIKKYNHPAR